MRALVLLALLPALALAQARPPSSGSGGTACALASSSAAFAASYRATTTTNLVPGYRCDGILEKCVQWGPGADAFCGTNASGEVVCGRSSGSTGVWRFYGTSHFATVNVQTLNVSNVAGVAIYQQTTAGYIDNPNGVLPVKVNDAHGFQVTCKTALTTCAAANEATVLPICGTGGAVTKQCLCTGDGTTYAWRNLLNPSAGAGTSSTCPAT